LVRILTGVAILIARKVVQLFVAGMKKCEGLFDLFYVRYIDLGEPYMLI
jgi:hypothetical protein